jgi:clan AA aspartic protease
MITGTVTDRRKAVVLLEVSGPHGHAIQVSADLDTGFTGFLTLTPADIVLLQLEYHGLRQANLADGSRVTLEIYRATVVWDGQQRSIQVVSARGGPLLGMAMLYGYDVNLQVVDGGVVTIKQLW